MKKFQEEPVSVLTWGMRWILEEVSVKYDTWEPFIQYIKSDDPKKQRAMRFGHYNISNGKRTKLLSSVYFEINTIQDLRKRMEETENYATETALKEAFG